jgi:phosphatidylglycerophosphate synthase
MTSTAPASREAVRVHGSFLAAAEKRCLVWIAGRLPAAVNSDHLTALGALAMLAAGICYWIGTPAALVTAVVMLAVNWFGDSLDGTVARVRHHERPRYGFYVDHVLDAIGILFIIAGLVLGGHMSALVGAGFLLAYYLLTIEIALATYAVGVFRISFWKLGPTELRILLAIGTLKLLDSGAVVIAGRSFLLFDIGCGIGIVALLATFIASAWMNTRTLYRAEPLPHSDVPGPLGRRLLLSLRVGPHPHALSLGDFAPRSGRRRVALRVGPTAAARSRCFRATADAP